MFFDWISIVFIAILVIAFIVGITRGFIASLSMTLGVAIALVAAFFLSQYVASWLMSAGAFNSLNDQVLVYIKEGLVSNGYDNWQQMQTAVSAFDKVDGQIADVLNAIKIPSFLQNILLSFIRARLPETGNNVVIADAVAEGITFAVATAISFVSVFVLVFAVFLVIKIVAWFLRKAGHKRPSMLSRIAGGIVQMANSFLFIYVIAFVLGLLASSVPSIGSELTNILHLGTNDWSFAKWLVENNAILEWISQFLAH